MKAEINTNKKEFEHLNNLTEKIIGAAFEVANELGPGFLEKVYERALKYELEEQGIKTQGQVQIPISYKTKPIGTYIADLLVEEKILIELKCINRFAKEHMAQCINYLTATGLKICLLINFQKPKVEWKRIVNNLE